MLLTTCLTADTRRPFSRATCPAKNDQALRAGLNPSPPPKPSPSRGRAGWGWKDSASYGINKVVDIHLNVLSSWREATGLICSARSAEQIVCVRLRLILSSFEFGFSFLHESHHAFHGIFSGDGPTQRLAEVIDCLFKRHIAHGMKGLFSDAHPDRAF